MGRADASKDSSRVAAILKHMRCLAEMYEETVVEMQCEELYYEEQRRSEPAEDCRARERQCRRRLAQLSTMSEEVTT